MNQAEKILFFQQSRTGAGQKKPARGDELHVVGTSDPIFLYAPGVSFSITKLDAELKKLWDLPCESVGYTKL